MRKASARFLSALLGLAASGGCFPSAPKWSYYAIWAMDSPGREARCILYRSTSDALSDYDYALSVQVKAQATYPALPESMLWKSYGCAPSYVVWLDDRTIALLLDRENPKCKLEPSTAATEGEPSTFQTVILDQDEVLDDIRRVVGQSVRDDA